MKDPRHFQIIALTALLFFGWADGAFGFAPFHFGAIVATAFLAQALGSLLNAVRIDFKSPLITALSLTLLLRADAAWPLALAAAIAIGSKFTLRLNGKHIFNPANIGIVATVLLADAAWTTPGQWGTALWFAALLAGAGFFITYRAARIDMPVIFLGVYATLLFARALWLGDPFSIPLLRLENGALILFAFFMISDPKTTPDGAWARTGFATATAVLAYVFSYHFYLDDGLFYALALTTLARPAMELFDPAPLYQWGDAVKPPAWISRVARLRRRSGKPAAQALITPFTGGRPQ
ncbi:MAG: RnfABCDGE type electron transport complex subunit D [Parvularculaceae bacterium]